MNPLPDLVNEVLQAKRAVELEEMLKSFNKSTIDVLFNETRSRTDREFGKVIRGYTPGDKFPSISVTGSRCELNCAHCNKKYLGGMIPALNPDSLLEILNEISKKGGTGALISGGSTKTGIVEMHSFYPVLTEIKNKTGLYINVHTGLIDLEMAQGLRKTGIDAISLDLVGDNGTIHDIYGLNKTVDDYRLVLDDLQTAGFTRDQIIPHVCIGLDKGEVRGEYKVLDYMKELDPRLVVFIILIPPRTSTSCAPSRLAFKQVDPIEVGRLVATARILYPRAGISLGCMRPGGRARGDYDLIAFSAGITRIALPTRVLLKRIEKRGYTFERLERCCAI